MSALLHAFVLANIICILNAADVDILIKKNPKGGRIIRKLSPATFYQFLQHTNAYVDKTPFIEYIMSTLNDHNHFVISVPPRWGKSQNLKLLSFFLEIQLEEDGMITQQSHTKAYKFFKHGEIQNVFGSPDNFNKPPLISNYARLIRHYLAKYPVIYLDFGQFNGLTNFTEYVTTFRSTLKNTFSSHTLPVVNLCINRLNIYGSYKPEGNCTDKELARFYQILRNEPTEPTDLRKSLSLLSKLLNTSYEKQVVVMIDNYDSFLHNCYTRQYGYLSYNETLDLEKFYLKFLRSILRSDYVHKIVMTGTLPILLDYGSDFEHIKYLRHSEPEIYPFYGFSKSETNTLIKYANIHETLARKACGIYEGYHVEKYPITKIFNPSAIVQFVNNGEVENYVTNYSDTFTYEVLRNDKITYLLTKLRSYQCLSYGPLQPQPFTDLRRLEGIRYNYNNDSTSQRLLLWYLNAVGVLTILDNGQSYCTKVPNFELHNELNSILFGNRITYMYELDAAHALMQIIENKTNKVTVLLRYFKKMLIFDSQVDDWAIDEQELRLRFFDILNEANKTYNYEVTIEEPCEGKSNLFQPIMSISKVYAAVDTSRTHQIVKESAVIIVQIKYQQTNNNLKRTLSQDLWPYCRTYLARHRETKSLKLIVINVRDTLIIQYSNYSFTDVSQVPTFKNVKMFEIDVEQV